MNYQSSITGYHNPKKHTGLKAEEFLLMYVRRMARIALKRTVSRKDAERIFIICLVLRDWNEKVKELKEWFPKTLV